MLSDRTLRTMFGLSPHSTALWGDLIRVVCAMTAILLLLGLAIAYTQIAKNTVTVRHLQDFGLFYESTLQSRLGGHLYQADRLPGANKAEQLWDLNPPHFHVLIFPFTYLKPTRAFIVWLLAGGLALIASVEIIRRSVKLSGRDVCVLYALMFGSAAVPAILLSGQVGLILLVPFTIAWHEARHNRDASAGAWMGICASVKPFLLLFLIYFVLVGRIRAARVAVLALVAAFALGFAIYGLGAHVDWIYQLSSVTWAEHYMNASLLGLVERNLAVSQWQAFPIFNRPGLVWPIWLTLACVIGFLTLYRVGKMQSVDRQFLLVTLAALLLSPLGWVYYLWLLIPSLTATVVSGKATQRLRQKSILGFALIGLLVPPSLPWMSFRWASGLATATLGSIYCWALIALWIVAWSGPKARTDPS